MNRKRQRKDINRMLKDLYGSPRALSHILQKRGLSQKQIDRLEKRHLTVYLDSLVERLTTFWKRSLSTKKYEILRAHYALRGEELAKQKELARQFNSSETHIEKYRKRALELLRHKKRLSRFEELVAESAREVLRRNKA